MSSSASVYDSMSSLPMKSYDREWEEFAASFPPGALNKLQAMNVVFPLASGSHLLGSLDSCDDLTLVSEFSSLEEISRYRNCQPVAGAQRSNKNRYCDVLPSEQTFQHMFFSEDHEEHPYFNGNEVVGDNGQAYFLTQAPVPAAYDDFWRMAYFSDVIYIVMLTNIVEGKRVKANRYWPEKQGTIDLTTNTSEFIEYSIRDNRERSELVTKTMRIELLSSCRVSDAIMKREMSVCPNSGDYTPHKVIQYQYLGWPDHGVPRNPNELVRLIRFTMQSPAEAPDHPLLVHCSAGIGRTGTFIAAHMEISRIQIEGNLGITPVNVMQDCDKMRRVRPGTVQSFEQYAFIFKTISTYSKELAHASRKTNPVVKEPIARREEPKAISRPRSSLSSTRKLRRKISVLAASSSLDPSQCKLCSKVTFL